MGRLEELDLKESQIWTKMKSHSEEATTANKHEIENLMKALDEAQNRSQTITTMYVFFFKKIASGLRHS